MSSTKDHPLFIPELSLHISRFVTLKDATACAQVCKAWNDAFTSAIWHTIDFKVQSKFLGVDAALVKKHGHHIRIVKGIESTPQLLALHHSSICRLRGLAITIPPHPQFRAYCGDILRQNATSILNLEMRGKIIVSDPPLCFPFDAISPSTGSQATSRLSVLKIRDLPITRDGFSSLLRMCPSLTRLNIRRIAIYSASCFAEPYQHTGITELVAPLKQIFRSDPNSGDTPSILVHFPGLVALHTWCSESSPPMSFGEMKDQFAQHCPLIKAVGIDTPATITAPLLTKTFQTMTRIIVDEMSPEIITAILTHQETLADVITFHASDDFYEQEGIPPLASKPLASGRELQLIPQTCSRLTTLELPTLQQDMDDIESTAWSCTQLEELYIRIRGLDTKDMVDRAIHLWVDYREEKRKNRKENPENCSDLNSSGTQGDIVADTLHNSDSVEERVARHLVRFEKLKKVWLGHTIKCVQV